MSWDIHCYTFSSKALYALNKKIPSKCQYSDLLLLSWKLIKFLMSFFKPPVNFSLNIASPFKVMTMTPLWFVGSNIIYFAQKELIKVQILRLSSVELKFTKLPMSFSKGQVSSTWYFASFFSVMSLKSSVLFWIKHNILSTKVAHQSANIQTFDRSHEN